MDYNGLYNFIENRMRMSHIYQPVMIKALLENGGELSDYDLGKKLLEYDTSQIEYYQKIVNVMVGKILRKHNIVYKEKTKYTLNDFDSYTEDQIKECIQICDEKIKKYIKMRGKAPWNHRNYKRNYIPGSIRYEVLKRAKYRCELCGVSADEKALEVDHIVPKSLGGEDSINNYQALCYPCNSSKSNRDSKSFRNQAAIYSERSDNCLFCNLESDKVIIENNLAYAIKIPSQLQNYIPLLFLKGMFRNILI